MNLYELYELSVSPYPETIGLKKKYYELSKKYHPDTFVQDTDASHEMLQVSALVNEGLTVFTNEMKSLDYFFNYHQVNIQADKTSLPADFLMEMMELNEQIDEANDSEEKNKIRSEVEQIDKALTNNIMITWSDAEKSHEQKIEIIKLDYLKKKYIQRILDSLS